MFVKDGWQALCCKSLFQTLLKLKIMIDDTKLSRCLMELEGVKSVTQSSGLICYGLYISR